MKESEEGVGRVCWILKAANLIRAKGWRVKDARKARDEAVTIMLTTNNGMLFDGPGIRLEHDRDEQRSRKRGVNKHQAGQRY